MMKIREVGGTPREQFERYILGRYRVAKEAMIKQAYAEDAERLALWRANEETTKTAGEQTTNQKVI